MPSISSLLERTGEFQARTLKGYDDTAFLIREVLANGLDSGRARPAFERITTCRPLPHHKRRLRYVISTFVFSPIDWLDIYGRRSLSEAEREDWFVFWCEFGRRMGIADLFIDIAGHRDLVGRFEAERFAPAPSNRSIAQRTIDPFLVNRRAFCKPRELVLSKTQASGS